MSDNVVELRDLVLEVDGLEDLDRDGRRVVSRVLANQIVEGPHGGPLLESAVDPNSEGSRAVGHPADVELALENGDLVAYHEYTNRRVVVDVLW